MTDQQWRSLQAGLRSLADDTSEGTASPAVERALKAALSVRQERGVPLAWRWAMAASLAAAGVLGVFVLRSGSPGKAGLASRPALEDSVEAYTPWFVQRGGIGPVRGQVVRMRVSRGTAAAFGVRGVGYSTGAAVEADVFIGDDGIMRAIRFVR